MDPAYVVSSLPGVGRVLLAARDLRPLELVLSDAPSAVGPDQDVDAPVCVACFGDIGEKAGGGGCPKCGLRLICSKVGKNDKRCSMRWVKHSTCVNDTEWEAF